VTEGPPKADVAFHLSGVPTIAVAGVSAWELALPVLREPGVKNVPLAIDADWRSNLGA
jgi:hypothetical protein